MKFSELEKKQFLSLARTVIASELGIDNLKFSFSPSSQGKLILPFGVFVTLKKGKEVRGSMGFVDPMPLGRGIMFAAKLAAFEDPVYPPLHKEELDEVSIEITLLFPAQEVSPEKAIDKIAIGKTGVLIKSSHNEAFILPQIAKESKWSPEDLLEQACEKAGLMPDAWKDATTKIYLFNGEVISE